MSIDLEKAYFKKLEKYVGKKININCPLCQGHFELV